MEIIQCKIGSVYNIEQAEQNLKETCHFPALVISYNDKLDRLNAKHVC